MGLLDRPRRASRFDLGLFEILLFASGALLIVYFRSSLSDVVRDLLGSILSSQADPPTFKSLMPPRQQLSFLNYQGLEAEDALQRVWKLSWALFESAEESKARLRY